MQAMAMAASSPSSASQGEQNSDGTLHKFSNAMPHNADSRGDNIPPYSSPDAIDDAPPIPPNVAEARRKRKSDAGSVDIRQRFLSIARSRAAHFANFSSEQEVHGSRSAALQQNAHIRDNAAEEQFGVEIEVKQDEDWPGPFSTARKLARERASTIEKRENDIDVANACNSVNSEPVVAWVPSRATDKLWRGKALRTEAVHTLYDSCLSCVCENIDLVESLAGMPDSIAEDICNKLCARRKLKSNVVSLLLEYSPSEIHIPDCSQISEQEFTPILAQYPASKLEVLDLRMCGRCISDGALISTIASASDSLPLLHSLFLSEAYRLSDKGLMALVCSAPSLRSVTLKQCTNLTEDGLLFVAKHVGKNLSFFSLEGCFQLNCKRLLPGFRECKNIRRLNLSSISELTDDVLFEILSSFSDASGLLELRLSQCCKLTDAAVSAIGAFCPRLETLDLQGLTLISDVSLTSLSSPSSHCSFNFKTLNFSHLRFSDECLSSFVSSAGHNLLRLSINSIHEAGDRTLLAISTHCKAIEFLDVSWCRKMSNQGLGFLADSCPNLNTIRVFGLSQINQMFVSGHSNENLHIVGLSDQYE